LPKSKRRRTGPKQRERERAVFMEGRIKGRYIFSLCPDFYVLACQSPILQHKTSNENAVGLAVVGRTVHFGRCYLALLVKTGCLAITTSPGGLGYPDGADAVASAARCVMSKKETCECTAGDRCHYWRKGVQSRVEGEVSPRGAVSDSCDGFNNGLPQRLARKWWWSLCQCSVLKPARVSPKA
jgi:hypothetical protein